MTLVLELGAVYTMLFNALALFCFVVGSCWIFIEITEDITDDLKHLKRNKQTDRSNRKIKKHFFRIVQLFSDAKQLSSNSKH